MRSPRPSSRSLVASGLIIAGLTVYALLVMQIGARLTGNGWLIWAFQIVFYLVAGLIWIVPARRIVRWSIQAGGAPGRSGR